MVISYEQYAKLDIKCANQQWIGEGYEAAFPDDFGIDRYWYGD